MLPKEEFRRHSIEDRIAQQFHGGKNLRAARGATRLGRCDRFECDRRGRTRDHAFAALHAGRLAHRVIEIEADAGRVAFAGATNDVIFHHIIACADAPIAQNARAVIDGEDRR